MTGGPASFVIPINDRAQFVQATRTKLILEISGLVPSPKQPLVHPASAEQPRISCFAGERLWQERWGRDF